MSWTPEELRVFLSETLHKDNLEPVIREIEAMQHGRGMVAPSHEEEMLQGDVYGSVPCVTRQGGQLAISPRRVMLISNSCDASPGNKRHMPLELTVAPVLKLSRYAQLLEDHGVKSDTVSDVLRAIKHQEKTNLVYLPAGAGLEEEMVVLLEKAQSLTYDDFATDGAPQRLAVLTQRGFWILLVKLSMHYLRPHEGVERAAA